MTVLTLTADLSGERADQFLSRSVEELTRSAAQKLMRSFNKSSGTIVKALEANLD